LRELLTREYNIIPPHYTFFGIIPKLASGRAAIYDGDTVKLMVDLGMANWQGPLNYRLLGIQAPEIRPLVTREVATASRDYLTSLVEKYAIGQNASRQPIQGDIIIVRTHKKFRPKTDYRPTEVRGKFGRYLVELIGQDEHGGYVNLNQMMIQAGHAVEYRQ